MKLDTQPCKICGTPVTRNAKAFTRGAICSTECRKKSAKLRFKSPPTQPVPCVVCGTVVSRTAAALERGRPICSHKCRGAIREPWNRGTTVMRKAACSVCGIGFERPASSYQGKTDFCSQRCFRLRPDKAKRPVGLIEVSCCACEKPFKRKPLVEGQKAKPYCSDACRAAGKIERRVIEKEEYDCFHCGAPTMRPKGTVRPHCSMACYVATRKAEALKAVTVPCVQCGADVKRMRYRLETLKLKPYCSIKCFGEASSIRQSKKVVDGRLFNGRQGGSRWVVSINGQERHMKSSYERIYAEYLISSNITFEYEPKIFKLATGMRYTPDFYLVDSDEWVEVKGYMSELAKRKVEAFAAIPGNRIRVLYKSDIQAIIGKENIDTYIRHLNKRAA